MLGRSPSRHEKDLIREHGLSQPGHFAPRRYPNVGILRFSGGTSHSGGSGRFCFGRPRRVWGRPACWIADLGTARQLGLALAEPQRPKIPAVELQQVKCMEDRIGRRAPAMERFEYGDAVGAGDGGLAAPQRASMCRDGSLMLRRTAKARSMRP